MSQISETTLPGVGVRHEFTTESGQVIGVLVHHDGRRDLLIYDSDDVDSCIVTSPLTAHDTQVLAELLGASQVEETIRRVQDVIDGLAIEWIEIPEGSAAGGVSIADRAYRERTGASIVAVLRGGTSIPAPTADFVLEAGDTVVAVSTQDGVAALRELLLTPAT